MGTNRIRSVLMAFGGAAMIAGGCTEPPSPNAVAGRQASATIESAAPKGNQKMATKTATFGGGCFWGVEEAFRTTKGVVSTDVGYAGGTMASPTYRDVCGGRTGHAEVVRVHYDPAAISYDALLELFWIVHDPTQVDRQGPDVGEQYRSVVFFHDAEQEAAARASMKRLGESGKFNRPIATRIEAAGPFYRAEEYHQQYLAKRGESSCHINVGGH